MVRVLVKVLIVVAISVSAHAEKPVNAEVAFDILRDRLVGEWNGKIVHSSEPVNATFYLTGNDSAIVEYI